MTLSTDVLEWGVTYFAQAAGVGMVMGLVIPLVASAFCAVVHAIKSVMSGGR